MDPLQLAASLFDTLDSKDIAYIHWKSNEHLHAAVRGQTDLDLLVPEENRERFRAVVDTLGFVTMLAPEVRRVPGLESFLGFDEATGSLLHLDVQYRLVLGEQLIKNHHLPIESRISFSSKGRSFFRSLAEPRNRSSSMMKLRTRSWVLILSLSIR